VDRFADFRTAFGAIAMAMEKNLLLYPVPNSPTYEDLTVTGTAIFGDGTNETSISPTGNILLPAGAAAAGKYPIKFQAGTALAAADADLVLDVGESCWLPINPAGNLGLCLDGVGPTTAVSWLIVGNAP